MYYETRLSSWPGAFLIHCGFLKIVFLDASTLRDYGLRCQRPKLNVV